MRILSFLRAGAWAAGAGLTLAACTPSAPPNVEQSPISVPSTLTPTDSLTPSSAPTVTSLPGANMADKQEEAGEYLGVVVDLQVDERDHSIHIKTKDAKRPGWIVSYVDTAIEQGRGDPIPVPGAAVLDIVLVGFPLPDTPEKEALLSKLPDQLTPANSVIKQVVNDGLYEGQLHLVAGLDKRRPYKVTWDESAQEIVINFGA